MVRRLEINGTGVLSAKKMDVRRSWLRDPLALMEGVCAVEPEGEGSIVRGTVQKKRATFHVILKSAIWIGAGGGGRTLMMLSTIGF